LTAFAHLCYKWHAFLNYLALPYFFFRMKNQYAQENFLCASGASDGFYISDVAGDLSDLTRPKAAIFFI
jgi:hypothetical protein